MIIKLIKQKDMKKYILMIAACMMMTSCLDTIILPDDKTVDEDFWQTKEDVSSMVNAAYSAMTTEDVMTRIIIWGDYRSDELVRSNAFTGAEPDALDEVKAVSMQTTNRYATWAGFYSVINRCNMVLDRAEEVVEKDPNYTQSDYMADRSQMLALRSLCYFYLVRAFRDVPYITESYMTSSQNRNVSQSAPSVVLEGCIKDLKEAVGTALSSRSYGVSEWRRVGWFTADGIRTLLADVYLWRASVTHNTADYQACADLCSQVIASKRSQHVRGRNEVVEKEFPLANADRAYYELFVEQNAEESIFELQSTNNVGLCRYYFKGKDNNSTSGLLKASSIFSSAANTVTSVSDNQVYFNGDLRHYAACYHSSKNTSEENFSIRKMIGMSSVNDKTTEDPSSGTGRTFANYDQNFNIYRLSDAMLMRAEALIELADPSTVEDPSMREAFHLIQMVNAYNLYQITDSMKWNTFKTGGKSGMEKLLLQERLREFCFEGKRWFDLLRYNYRHVEGVDYNRILADQVGDNGYSGVKNYSEMLKLMTRGSGSEAEGIKAKMVSEAYLYMPIPNSDINVCPLLKQNPVYSNNSKYSKNY